MKTNLPLVFAFLFSFPCIVTSQTNKFPMDQFIGTNIWWDFYGKNLEDPGTTDINVLNSNLQGFFQNLDAVGFVREFHNWYLHEGIEAGCPNANICYTNTPEQPSPPYSAGVKFKFKTAYQGQASCINFDYFYELLLQHLASNLCISMSGSATTVIKDYVAEPICGFTSAQERIPVNSSNPSDFLNPQKYKEFATYLYHFAYRYGDDASTPTASPANILSNLAPESQTSFVNNPAIRSVTTAPLKYMSIWNEEDKWWLEGSMPHTYITPEEYGPLLSAVVDGHQGQVTHQNLYTLGIKNADSNMKIVLGGISELDPCYFQTMADWLDQNRTGTNKFPFDVFNYHHYSQIATANYEISQFCSPINADQLNAWNYGVSPEEDKLKGKLKTLRQTIIDKGSTFNQDWNTKEFWITEYGYDTHPASVQAAIPENNPITGQNNLRSLIGSNYRPNWNALPQSQKNMLLDLVELAQARWIARSFLEIAAAGFDRAIGYEFADRAEIGTYQTIGPYTESGRFLTSGSLFFDPTQPVANRFTKKTSWHFINTMKHLLAGYKFNVEVSYNNCNDAISSGCPRIYKFTKAGADDIWAMWLPTSNESVSSIAVNLGIAAGSTVQLIKLADGFPNGQPPIALSVGANGLLAVSNLSETPIFIKAGSSGGQSQAITLSVIANKLVSDTPFIIAATASSGLAVSFEILSGPATISGNTITLTGQVGTVVVRATQAGNASWNPAPAVDRSFTVSQAGLQTQAILFNTIPNQTTTSPPFAIDATASSGLTVSLQIVSGPATISGNTITLNGQVGTVVVRATQAGNTQWNPAIPIERTFIVSQQSGGGTIDLSLTVSNSPNSLVIYNNMDFTFTVTNNGTATATNVEVHVPTPSTVVFVGTNAATLSQGIYNWIDNRLWLVGSLAPGATATMTVHWFVLDTNQLMGWAQVSHADQTDTDSTPDNATAGIVSEDDEAVKNIGTGQTPPAMANQVTTFGTLANKLTTDPQFTLNATASSGLAVTFNVVSGPASVSGNMVTLSGQPGSVIISASQAGNADFNPAPNVNRTFQVTTPTSGNGLDLELKMTANAVNVTQWGYIAYTATLTNTGNATATGVKVHFPKPASVVYNGGNEAVASKGSYLPYGDQQWVIGSMAPGAAETLTLNFYILQNVPLTGYAQVSAASPSDNDSTPSNGVPPTPIEDDEAAFTVGASGSIAPDLELAITSSSPTLTIWQNVTLTILLNNVGNAPISDVKVAMPIPQGLAYTMDHPPFGTTYDIANSEWTIGTMAAGTSKTMAIELFVLQNTTPVPYFAQVKTASNADLDSSPNNNNNNSPTEDDEALLTLQPPSHSALGIPGEVFYLFASQNGATAKLRWSTNSGRHCLRYMLERSVNGFEWQLLAVRDNDEQNGNFITYLEVDERPLSGWNFYRVVQLRNNGSLTFSNVQMLEFWEELDEFQLFPNPADSYVNVNLRSVEGQTVRLLLMDRMGRLVKEAWVEPATLEHYRLDIAEVHEGWYALWIQAEGKRAKSLPLMVSKF